MIGLVSISLLALQLLLKLLQVLPQEPRLHVILLSVPRRSCTFSVTMKPPTKKGLYSWLWIEKRICGYSTHVSSSWRQDRWNVFRTQGNCQATAGRRMELITSDECRKCSLASLTFTTSVTLNRRMPFMPSYWNFVHVISCVSAFLNDMFDRPRWQARVALPVGVLSILNTIVIFSETRPTHVRWLIHKGAEEVETGTTKFPQPPRSLEWGTTKIGFINFMSLVSRESLSIVPIEQNDLVTKCGGKTDSWILFPKPMTRWMLFQAASRFEDYVGCVSWNYKVWFRWNLSKHSRR